MRCCRQHNAVACCPFGALPAGLSVALPAIFVVCAVYRTIDSVETFVCQHYAEQIAKLQDRPACAALCALLATCRLNAVAHSDDARSRVQSTPGRARALVDLCGCTRFSPGRGDGETLLSGEKPDKAWPIATTDHHSIMPTCSNAHGVFLSRLRTIHLSSRLLSACFDSAVRA